MSLLVALSLSEAESGCESTIYNLDSGEFLLKLLHRQPTNELVTSLRNNEHPEQTARTIGTRDSDEMFEMLSATTPKRFSNFVQKSIANNIQNQVISKSTEEDNSMSCKDGPTIIYQKRNILDLGTNLAGSNVFLGPAPIPRTKKAILENHAIISWLNGEKPTPASIESCADEDCKFQEEIFTKKFVDKQ